GGTGLGLAIVKHIASRHRAALTIESEVGKGSIFTLRFPHTPSPSGDGEAG
ncbi:MAG: ATP-binding protein, partial [Alphaproteobacteria bacterium]|nr:ATP-binding protein [Alphaproteobacteria bacterium]